MGEPANAADPGRLQAVEAVTREYARYSRTAYGLAYVVTGAALLLTVAVDAAARSRGVRLVCPLLRSLWLLSLAAARAFYQRHGEVVEPDQRVLARRWVLGLAVFLSGGVVFSLVARGLDPYRGDWRLTIGVLLAVFATVAVPVLTSWVVRGQVDAGMTMTLLMVSAFVPQMQDSPLRRIGGFGECAPCSSPLALRLRFCGSWQVSVSTCATAASSAASPR